MKYLKEKLKDMSEAMNRSYAIGVTAGLAFGWAIDYIIAGTKGHTLSYVWAIVFLLCGWWDLRCARKAWEDGK